MTAPNGPMLFNSSTGSDTAASGLGPASALSGAGASTTSASAVVTGITTTGVTAGDMLWVQSSSGRQFSVIASVDSGTQVTCDDVFANTESSRTWAIGGKRATFDNVDSRNLFNDLPAGGTIQTESDQAVTSTIESYMAGTMGDRCVIRGAAGSEVVSFSGTTGHLFRFYGSHVTLSYMHTERTGTSTSPMCRIAGGTHYTFDTVMCNSQSNPFYGPVQTGGYGSYSTFRNCAFGYSLVYGVSLNASNYCSMINCILHDSTQYGLLNNSGGYYFNCIFARNNMQGAVSGSRSVYDSCIFWKNSAASGVRPALALSTGDSVLNCIFAENYQDAISGSSTASYAATTDNVFYNNVGSDFTTPLPQFNNNITLTADPFVDAANLDFSLNQVTGGGATLRAEISSFPNFDAHPYNWLTDGSGGGGATHYDPFTNPRF